MFHQLYLFLTSKDPNKQWLQLLLFLMIILILFIFAKQFNTAKFYEGFIQDQKFVLKTENAIYDDFYAKIYDELNKTSELSTFTANTIIPSTQPDSKSIFLDIGCGTGNLVATLQQQGFRTFGIDKSQAMIDCSKNKSVKNIICSDVTDAMAFEPNSFSHITCIDFTIYQFENKRELLQNCYKWLLPHGYFIVHLVDRKNFSPIVPLGKPILLDNPQKYSKQRITDTKINFIDFSYKGSYDFSKSDKNQVIFKETFTDTISSHVRQNELTMHVENINELLQLIHECKFILHAKFSMQNFNGDEHQYMYIFEKPN